MPKCTKVKTPKPMGRPPINKRAPETAALIIPTVRECGSIAATARKLGLGRTSVTNYLMRHQTDYQAARKAFANLAMSHAVNLIDNGYRRRREMSAMQAVTAGAILVDKSLALAGDAPGQGPRVQINAVVADLANTIQALRQAAAARREGRDLSAIDIPQTGAQSDIAQPPQHQQDTRGTSHNGGYGAADDDETEVGEG